MNKEVKSTPPANLESLNTVKDPDEKFPNSREILAELDKKRLVSSRFLQLEHFVSAAGIPQRSKAQHIWKIRRNGWMFRKIKATHPVLLSLNIHSKAPVMVGSRKLHKAAQIV